MAVVFDFRRVTGVDSSGFEVFGQIHSELEAAGCRLVLAGMSPTLKSGLNRAHSQMVDAAVIREDLDQALEWTEDGLLTRFRPSDTNEPGAASLSAALRAHFSEVRFQSAEVLLEQGQPGDTLLFVLSGSMIAVRVADDGSRRRLRRFGANTWLGEVAFFTGGARTAEVVAVVDATALQLTRRDYANMRAAEPKLALELHDLVMAAQAARNTSLSIDLSRSLS